MSSGNKVFGKRIKELRERKKLTQERLAEKVGLDLQTISRIETGYYFTSFENLEKLANALDVTMADLFNFGRTLNIIRKRRSKNTQADFRVFEVK